MSPSDRNDAESAESQTQQPTAKASAFPSDVGELQAELRRMEQRLRDLTDQSLGFLEQLGEARRERDQTEIMRERINGLEQLLGDARRKLQVAGGEVLRAAPTAGRGSLDVVVWGGVPSASGLASIVEHVDGAAVTCIISDEVDVDGIDTSGEVQWFRTTSPASPARDWNAGLGATAAPAILFLHVAAIPDAGDWGGLPSADDTVAVVQPLVRRGGVTEVGRTDPGDFTESQPLIGGAEPTLSAIPNAEPQAFVLIRAFVERVGPFDEDLLGPLALTEFIHRLADRGGRVVAWPTIAVEMRNTVAELPAELRERDRLLVMARHRPERLGEAWAGAEFLWHLEPDARTAFLRALLLRLPASHQWPEGLEVARAIAEAAVRGTMSPVAFEALFGGLLRDKIAQLQSMEGTGFHEPPPENPDEDDPGSRVFARLQALSDMEQRARDHLVSKAQDLAARLGAAETQLGATESRLEAARAAEDRATREILDLRGSLDALRQQLVERESWIATLLQQSTRGRLSPFGRKLQEHEAAFLRRVDGPQS